MKQLIFALALFFLPLQGTEQQMTQEPLAIDQTAATDGLIQPYSSTNQDIVSVTMAAGSTKIAPSKPFWVAFQFQMGKEWHLYWINPGDAGQGPKVDWTLPEGFHASDLIWPTPERIVVDQAVVFGYSNKVTLLCQITPPNNLKIGSKVDLKAVIDWYGCSTVCVPGVAYFRLPLEVAAESEPASKEQLFLIKRAKKSLPLDVQDTKSTLLENGIEIDVHQDMPFGTIKSAYFFPEQPDVLDTHRLPSWKLSSDKKSLVVHVAGDKLHDPTVKYPLKGVLVVEEESPLGALHAAWDVRVAKSQAGSSAAPKEKIKNVDAYLEDLENKVWYRSLLVEFSQFIKSDFAKILLWAFLGGILLNIMPCVLPVISIKLMHFVQLQGYSRMQVAKHGLMYSFGVLISFWLLSGTIYVLQSFGHVIGWGFQLQEPIFVALMIIVLFILSLSLFGLFEFGMSLASTTGAWEQSFVKRSPASSDEPSYLSSFASGILATFVAAPCTGPLLGSAIGFAATLQPTYSFAIFSALGLGMAFPFLFLSLFPGLTKFLPKPGRWMVTFKQLMGFFMLATVLWLVWVLEAETTGLSSWSLLLSLFIIGFGVWVYGNWCGFDRTKRTRLFGKIAAFIIIVAGAWYFIADVQKAKAATLQPAATPEKEYSQAVGKEWEKFSLPRIERLRQQGIPVFVDVTAKWCLTCQTNHLVLDSDKVQAAFVKYGVVKMKADWTQNDENITRYIRSLGRNGVPVYVLYSGKANAKPEVLPEVLTPDLVVDALKKIHEEKSQ